jgi:hypothetical protein
MRQARKLQGALNAPDQRTYGSTCPQYVASAGYAARRRKGGLLQHGVEVLLWAAAGTGVVALALWTADTPARSTLSPVQAAESARSDRLETTGPLVPGHLTSRAKAELSSRLLTARLGATGSMSAPALVEWLGRFEPSSVADKHLLSPGTLERSAEGTAGPVDHRLVDHRLVDHRLLEPTITGSVSAEEAGSTDGGRRHSR